jgi:hypothetical protein
VARTLLSARPSVGTGESGSQLFFRPFRAMSFPNFTHGLRHGLYSDAALRLCVVASFHFFQQTLSCDTATGISAVQAERRLRSLRLYFPNASLFTTYGIFVMSPP